MIPPQRPPFGIGRVLLASFSGSDMAGVEEACARAFPSQNPVWLPSARSGIYFALRAALQPGDKALGPAFTCGVVHEAMTRSGAAMELLDAADDDFLMSPDAITRAQTGRHALVLCELYGHEYDLASAGRSGPPPVIRIVDMAMTVPRKELFDRLDQNDFAIISFGIGKSMYAGWGAMGFTRNASLAEQVRKLRDAWLVRGGRKPSLQRAAKIGLRTLGHYPIVYTLAKRLRPSPPTKRAADSTVAAFPAAWSDEKGTSAEWHEPGTSLDCGLARWNLEHAAFLNDARMELARRYHDNLAGVPGLVRPRVPRFALSHYTVRVDGAIREPLRRALFDAGLNVITLWDFPRFLDKTKYPHAFQRSCEVINLPLIPGMSASRVDQVCEILRRCLASIQRQPAGAA